MKLHSGAAGKLYKNTLGEEDRGKGAMNKICNTVT